MAKTTTWEKLDKKSKKLALHNAVYTLLLDIRWIELSAKELADVANETVKTFAKNTGVKLSK